MQTIVFATQKGGSGKTTLCRSLAVEAVGEGKKVALLDLDGQGSLTNWHKRRETEDLTLVTGIDSAAKIAKAVELLASKGFDYLLVDTVGTADPVKEYAVKACDLVVMPCQASQDDLDSIKQTIADVRGQGKKFVFVLTRTFRSRLNDMAGRALGQYGLVAPANFANRQSHVEAAASGKTAAEIGNTLAAQETHAIWKFVKENL